MRLFSKKNFWPFIFRRSPLFAAFARSWGGEKKGEGEKHRPTGGIQMSALPTAGSARADPLIFWLRPTAEARGRARPSVANFFVSIRTTNVQFLVFLTSLHE